MKRCARFAVATSEATPAQSIHDRAINDKAAVCPVCITGRHGSCTGWARALFGQRRRCYCRVPVCVARREKPRFIALAVVLTALLLPHATGCAIGVIGADDSLRGVALGHAKVERCRETPWPGVPWDAPSECQRIEGGALSVSGWEFLGTLAAGAVAYVSGGVLP